MATPLPERTTLLELDEQHLAAFCRLEACRGSGPGGQKRNKTSSAVQVTLLGTDLSAYDDQERSQFINKHRALQKLRLEIALHFRLPPQPWTQPIPGPNHERRPLWVAAALDHLHDADFSVADAAKALGLSTGQLVKELFRTPPLWQLVNRERASRGFTILRAP